MKGLVQSRVRKRRWRFIVWRVLLLGEATPHAIDTVKREAVRHGDMAEADSSSVNIYESQSKHSDVKRCEIKVTCRAKRTRYEAVSRWMKPDTEVMGDGDTLQLRQPTKADTVDTTGDRRDAQNASCIEAHI